LGHRGCIDWHRVDRSQLRLGQLRPRRLDAISAGCGYRPGVRRTAIARCRVYQRAASRASARRRNGEMDGVFQGSAGPAACHHVAGEALIGRASARTIPVTTTASAGGVKRETRAVSPRFPPVRDKARYSVFLALSARVFRERAQGGRGRADQRVYLLLPGLARRPGARPPGPQSRYMKLRRRHL